MTSFDHLSDFEQGREDAHNGFPRTSTRAHYRAGYDRGLSESIARTRRYDSGDDRTFDVLEAERVRMEGTFE